jgi:hypothetical protein
VCLQREGHTDGNANASCRWIRRSPRAKSTSRNYTRENRETCLVSLVARLGIGPGSQKRNPDMNAREESSDCIVPTKRPNKAGKLVAEDVEGRQSAKEILRHGPTPNTVPDQVGALKGCEERWTGNRSTRQIQGGNRVR